MTKDRLQYSFIWDRVNFNEADNIADIVKIDPTDKNVDLGEQIQKYLNQKKKQQQEQRVKRNMSDTIDSEEGVAHYQQPHDIGADETQ